MESDADVELLEAENGAQEPAEAAIAVVAIINGERDGEVARDGFLRIKGQSPW